MSMRKTFLMDKLANLIVSPSQSLQITLSYEAGSPISTLSCLYDLPPALIPRIINEVREEAINPERDIIQFTYAMNTQEEYTMWKAGLDVAQALKQVKDTLKLRAEDFVPCGLAKCISLRRPFALELSGSSRKIFWIYVENAFGCTGYFARSLLKRAERGEGGAIVWMYGRAKGFSVHDKIVNLSIQQFSTNSSNQSTNSQSTNSQSTNSQSTNSQSTSSQSTNSQSTSSQFTNSQSTKAQSSFANAQYSQSTNDQSTNDQSTNNQTSNSQSTQSNLIEIERKFKLRESDLQTIKRIARFGGEKTYHDEYFDSPTYELTKKDTWLRKRNGAWECKVPIDNAGNQGTDYYLELTNESDILQFMIQNKIISAIDSASPLEQQLTNHKIVPFASIRSTRSKYRTDTFNFDLDVTDFGYSIGEIEIMVKQASEIPNAQKQIDQFVSENALVVSGVQGKVLTYLSRFRKEHYAALVSSGLISKKTI
eukprot:Phypoly_transcript_07299.p1 GENE.Phypoly_transcript_07299~~Phypoly_transcript_07299.p1  ORF type:complete len:500 (+),score=89.48 Phypoly_transcript_07299:59-1501(+)